MKFSRSLITTIHMNQVCWSRETSRTCRTVGPQGQQTRPHRRLTDRSVKLRKQREDSWLELGPNARSSFPDRTGIELRNLGNTLSHYSVMSHTHTHTRPASVTAAYTGGLASDLACLGTLLCCLRCSRRSTWFK